MIPQSHTVCFTALSAARKETKTMAPVPAGNRFNRLQIFTFILKRVGKLNIASFRSVRMMNGGASKFRTDFDSTSPTRQIADMESAGRRLNAAKKNINDKMIIKGMRKGRLARVGSDKQPIKNDRCSKWEFLSSRVGPNVE